MKKATNPPRPRILHVYCRLCTQQFESNAVLNKMINTCNCTVCGGRDWSECRIPTYWPADRLIEHAQFRQKHPGKLDAPPPRKKSKKESSQDAPGSTNQLQLIP